MNYVSFKVDGRNLRVEYKERLDCEPEGDGFLLSSGDDQATLKMSMGNPVLTVAHGRWTLERREQLYPRRASEVIVSC